MRGDGSNAAGWRSPRLAAFLNPLLGVALVLGCIDLHALAHDRRDAATSTRLADHPERAHLDDARVVHEVRCVGCLAGLRSQDRPGDTPRMAAGPEARGRVAAEASPFGPASVLYRLPLSRAPPLS